MLTAQGGVRCTEPPNPCKWPAELDCGEHGSCTPVGSNNAQCKCAIGWRGPHCEIAIPAPPPPPPGTSGPGPPTPQQLQAIKDHRMRKRLNLPVREQSLPPLSACARVYECLGCQCLIVPGKHKPELSRCECWPCVCAAVRACLCSLLRRRVPHERRKLTQMLLLRKSDTGLPRIKSSERPFSLDTGRQSGCS